MKQVRPRKILWPTDFSELSMAAGFYASDLCVLFGAELHVIHVCPPPLAPHIEALLSAEAASSLTDAKLLQATQAHLEQLVAGRLDSGRRVVCAALVGNPWSEICAYARRTQIGLIVIATHGVTGLRHILIGGTAERVVQHATCPVLTVKSLDQIPLGQ